MRLHSLLLAAGGLCVGLLIAEVGARVVLLVRPSRAAYTTAPAGTGALSKRIPLVHPYFGVSARRADSPADGPTQFQLPFLSRLRVDSGQERPLHANNHGFYAEQDYPYVGSPGDYIVGVFGGSVSNYFAAVESVRLAALLRQLPPWHDRRVVVLNFAQNGFKQPQQALILTYFLTIGQHFDAVVNIDGFNEAALGFYENWEQGIDVSMPRAYPGGLTERFLSPTDEQVAWQASTISTRHTLARLDGWNRAMPSAAGRLVIESVQALVERRAERLAATRPVAVSAASAGFFAIPAKRDADSGKGLAYAVDVWEAGSRTMADISKARGIAYLHVLQPNQYYSKHVFGEDERRAAIAAPYGYSKSVVQLYPLMEGRLAGLRQAGVDAVDGVGLFDLETSPSFIDTCCHYTRKGYDLVADLVSQRLSDALAAPRGIATSRP